MPPYAGKVIEVGGAVLLRAGIVPEVDRHARKGRRADELTRLAAHRASLVVEDLDRHAESAHLDLAAPYGSDRIAESEAGDEVRAATNAAETDVALHSLVDIVEAMRSERTPGGQNRPER